MRDSITRRRLLRAGGVAGVGLAATLAGCGGDGSNGGSGSSAALDVVPSEATGVVSLDTGRLLDDEMVSRGVNRAFEIMTEQGNRQLPVDSYSGALSRVESEVGLDPRGLQSVLTFVDASGDVAGVVFEAEWTAADIADALDEQGVSLTEAQSEGRTVYRDGQGVTRMAVLGSGQYLFGTQAGIEAALSVDAGEAEPVGGAVRDAYAGTAGGMVRFAADLSGTDFASESTTLPELRSVETVSGSLTASGDTRTLRIDMQTPDGETAQELATGLDSLVTLAEGQLGQYPEIRQVIENPERHFEAIETSASGSTATVTYSGSVDLVSEGVVIVLAAVVASFVLGLGESVSQTAPQATFATEYTTGSGETSWPDVQSTSDGDGTLSITHAGGDQIRAGNLYVSGSVGGQISWADASEYSNDSGITAGDTVAYRVASDDVVRVIWTGGDGRSAVLDRWTGPDA